MHGCGVGIKRSYFWKKIALKFSTLDDSSPGLWIRIRIEKKIGFEFEPESIFFKKFESIFFIKFESIFFIKFESKFYFDPRNRIQLFTEN